MKAIKNYWPDGKLDVLVTNAEVGPTGPLIEADLEMAKRLYDVNVLGPSAVAQAFASMVVWAKGKVVKVSSVGGLLPVPWGGMYKLLHSRTG